MRKRKIIGLGFCLYFSGLDSQCSRSVYEEYDLDNGLHVILHQDNTAPVVVTSQ